MTGLILFMNFYAADMTKFYLISFFTSFVEILKTQLLLLGFLKARLLEIWVS